LKRSEIQECECRFKLFEETNEVKSIIAIIFDECDHVKYLSYILYYAIFGSSNFTLEKERRKIAKEKERKKTEK
jgi:hypothetical protein